MKPEHPPPDATEPHVHPIELEMQPRDREAVERLVSETQMELLNAIPAQVALLDSEGVIQATNENWRQFAALNRLQSPDGYLGQSYLKTCESATGPCSEEAEDAAAGIRRVLRGEVGEFTLDYPCHSPTEQRWFRLLATPLRGARGGGALVMHVDITERKLTEVKLAQVADMVDRTGELAKIGGWSLNLGSMKLTWSRETFRIAEYDILEEPALEGGIHLFAPEARPVIAAAVQAAIDTGAPYDLELPLITAKGNRRWVQTQGFAEMEDGKVVRIHGTFQDITERREAEEARRAGEARARAIIEASPVAMALNDSEGRITFLNPAFTATFGYVLEDIPTLAEWWPKAYPDPAYRQQVAERWQAELDRSAGTGEAFAPMELSICCKDGTERLAIASAAPLGDTFAGVHLVVLHDVTENERIQARLRASQKENAELRAALNQHAIVAATDARGRITFVNDKFCDISQYSREELLGQDHRMINSGTHSKEFFRALWETIQSGRVWQGDICNRAKDGSLYWVDTTIVPFVGEHGAIERYLAIRKDITERVRAVAALRESAMQLSLVIRGGDIGFWDWDFPTNGLVVNDRWLTMLGLDPECQSVSMDLWNSLVHPDDAHKLVRLVDEVILNPAGLDGEVEIRARHADGHCVWLLDKFNVVERAADGSPLRVVGTHLDITARKVAELELRESEERFRQLAENIQEVFWIRDTAMNQLLYVSPASERVWGRTCAQLYQDPRSWLEAVHPEDRARIEHAAQTKQALGLYNETYRILRSDGEVRWIHDEAFPVMGPDGKVHRIVGAAADITVRVALEAQLRQSQKLQTVGTLAAGIAHDFNNILAAILGNTELALMETVPEHPARESLDEIRMASERGKDLVQQILAFSSQQPMERHSLALGPVVLKVAKLLRATIPAGVRIDTSVEPDAPPVLADAGQMHQILVNLCTNAWHALGDQPGCIDVTLRSVVLSSEEASRIGGLRPGRFACLSVRDDGKGMDAATLRRIFDPFFTTKGPGKGTGLGLSVVHGIVRGCQGAIQVVSQPGEGTTFTLYFPAAASAPASTVLRGMTPTSSRDASRHILYLDDDEALLSAATRLLEHLGHRVSAFVRPADAVKAFRENPRQFDLAVTDMNMPEVKGLAFAKELLTVRPDLPIVLVSGNVEEELRHAAREAGIRSIVCKPFSMDEISEAIQRVSPRVHHA